MPTASAAPWTVLDDDFAPVDAPENILGTRILFRCSPSAYGDAPLGSNVAEASPAVGQAKRR